MFPYNNVVNHNQSEAFIFSQDRNSLSSCVLFNGKKTNFGKCSYLIAFVC